MQQQQRLCGIADHKSQPIDYICVFSKCKTHRFLCSQCLKDGSHNHDQTNKYVLDANEIRDKISSDLKQEKDRQVQDYHIAKSVNPLKQIISEIQKQLKIINNVIQGIESGKLLNHDYQYLEEQLSNIKNHGFNQIDEQQLDVLINLDKQLSISDLDIYKQFEEKSKLIIQHAQEIKEWRLQVVIEDKVLTQKIKYGQYSTFDVHDCAVCHYDDDDRGYDRVHNYFNILSSTISNDLKYIVIGQHHGVLKIWDYETCKPIMAINYNKPITTCKFSNDSKFLYVGAQLLYKLDANNNFEEISKQQIHENTILNMLFISDDILLTTSDDKTIIKTEIHNKQQLLKIQAHDAAIYGLDYHHSLEIIASGSNDQSIKLWNGNDGALFIDKQNAHLNGKHIIQTYFLINSNQLVSVAGDVIVWNINYQAKQLIKVYKIGSQVQNIALGLDQQYIMLIKQYIIELYTIKGELMRSMNHNTYEAIPFNTTQLESMKTVLIQGLANLEICKVDLN